MVVTMFSTVVNCMTNVMFVVETILLVLIVLEYSMDQQSRTHVWFVMELTLRVLFLSLFHRQSLKVVRTEKQ